MILVTGATGRVGRHLVTGLIAEGAPVRALTRDPAAASLPAAAERAHFDPAKTYTIAAALTGTTPMFVNATAVGAVLPDLMTAASEAGVRRNVMLSSLTVSDSGTQEYAIGAQHKALEDVVLAAAPESVILRCGGFAANTLAWAPGIRAEGIVRVPYPESATALISERDIAAAAVTALLDDGHAGERYLLTGPHSMTQIEHVNAIGAAIGRDLATEELSPEAFLQAATTHMPAAAVDDLLRYYAQYVGRTAEMSPDLEKLIGRPGIAFADWAREHAASFR